MLTKTSLTQAGFTLLEVIVAAAIIGIMVVIGQRYYEKEQFLATSRTAKQAAHVTKQQVLQLMKRDLKQVMSVSNATISTPQDIRMRRLLLQAANASLDPNQTFDVRYDIQCAQIPASIRNDLQNVDFSLSSPHFAERSACIRSAALRCRNGTYPQIRITAPNNNNRVPAYEPNLYPDLDRNPESFRSQAIGAMFCLTQTASEITINLDVLYLRRADGGAEAVEVVSESSLAVIGNITGMPVLRR